MPKYYLSGRGFRSQRYLRRAYEYDPPPCLITSKTRLISQDLFLHTFKLFYPIG